MNQSLWKQTAWVFAGGDIAVQSFDPTRWPTPDFIVGVDSGAAHCLALDLVPDWIVGDFDSLDDRFMHDQRLANAAVKRYPSMKAASDLQLALELLCDCRPSRVIVFGVSGGRTDHLLFNWQLPASRHWPFDLRLVDQTVSTFVLQGIANLECSHKACLVNVQPGQLVSLLPLTTVEGVITKGLMYPLTAATLVPGTTLGLSNVANATTISVQIETGTLLLMVNQ